MRKLLTLTIVALLTITAPAIAGKARRQACSSTSCPTMATTRPIYYYPSYTTGRAPTYQVKAAEPRYYPAVYASPAPGGLLTVVNAARARYGLRPFAHDANLAAWSNQNNAACSGRGLGHHVLAPGAMQNAASTADPNYAVQLWLASPAHRAALLGSGTMAGLACSYGYSTLNAR